MFQPPELHDFFAALSQQTTTGESGSEVDIKKINILELFDIPLNVDGYTRRPFNFCKISDPVTNVVGFAFAECEKGDKYDKELGRKIVTAKAMSDYYKKLALELGK